MFGLDCLWVCCVCRRVPPCLACRISHFGCGPLEMSIDKAAVMMTPNRRHPLLHALAPITKVPTAETDNLGVPLLVPHDHTVPGSASNFCFLNVRDPLLHRFLSNEQTMRPVINLFPTRDSYDTPSWCLARFCVSICTFILIYQMRSDLPNAPATGPSSSSTLVHRSEVCWVSCRCWLHMSLGHLDRRLYTQRACICLRSRLRYLPLPSFFYFIKNAVYKN